MIVMDGNISAFMSVVRNKVCPIYLSFVILSFQLLNSNFSAPMENSEVHHAYFKMLDSCHKTYIIQLLWEGWNCKGLQYLRLKYKLWKLGREDFKLEYREGLVFYIKMGISFGSI